MAESLPSNAILSTVNMFGDVSGSGIVAVTSERNLFRKERLADPKRGRPWRSTSDGSTNIDLQIGTADLPQVFALIGSNLSASQTVRLTQADDADFTTNVAYWDFTTYAQSMRKVLRWYLGTADSGTAANRLYWRVNLPNNGADSDDYHELAGIWLGDYTSLPIDLGMSRQVVDPSVVAVSDGGAEYPDTRSTFHEIDASSSYVPEADSISIMDQVDAAGRVRHCLLDLFAPTSDDTIRANGTYYGKLGSGESIMEFARELQVRDSLDYSFRESRA